MRLLFCRRENSLKTPLRSQSYDFKLQRQRCKILQRATYVPIFRITAQSKQSPLVQSGHLDRNSNLGDFDIVWREELAVFLKTPNFLAKIFF
jgi:hypothetical protein